jgi:hypothetical protein
MLIWPPDLGIVLGEKIKYVEGKRMQAPKEFTKYFPLVYKFLVITTFLPFLSSFSFFASFLSRYSDQVILVNRARGKGNQSQRRARIKMVKKANKPTTKILIKVHPPRRMLLLQQLVPQPPQQVIPLQQVVMVIMVRTKMRKRKQAVRKQQKQLQFNEQD